MYSCVDRFFSCKVEKFPYRHVSRRKDATCYIVHENEQLVDTMTLRNCF